MPGTSAVVAVRVRDPKEKAWHWVGELSALSCRKSEAFTYPNAYRCVAEEVAERARASGLIAEVVAV
jgi:hypothetical protein